MSNDPRDLDGKRLQQALRLLGRDTVLRARLVEFLRDCEPALVYDGAVRDDVVGPIIDALHEDSDVYAKELADGTRMEFYYRTKIARDLLLSASDRPTHVWEPQTTKLLLTLARHLQGDVIVGGAYFGDQAVLVAKAIAPAGLKVHCFEPNPDQAAMLQSNVALNQLTNVVVNKTGLWNRSGERMRLDGFDSFANAVAASDGEGFSTEAMDDYAARQGIRVGLIQLDIEGAELAALQGAQQLLAKDRPAVVFEVHRHYVDWSQGLRATPICQLFLSLGYEIFAVRDINSHREMPGQPVELVPLDAVYLDGPPHGFNMLALPDASVLDTPEFRRVEGVSPKLLPHKAAHLHHPIGGF
ncbi:FkbM family methyltransferase [Simplicispira psychrophila]|uniref:FkbM family methyltransferase n=1 Tax=Simplicispira psychrophila TaxID=80882 RepID=UPI000B0E80DE|nr:FkbM family methyltransferase [Simplicispira psychrophila]